MVQQEIDYIDSREVVSTDLLDSHHDGIDEALRHHRPCIGEQ
jgi:hypothetical protein